MPAVSRPQAVFGRGRFRGNGVMRRDLDMPRMTATNYAFLGSGNNTGEEEKKKKRWSGGGVGGGGRAACARVDPRVPQRATSGS